MEGSSVKRERSPPMTMEAAKTSTGFSPIQHSVDLLITFCSGSTSSVFSLVQANTEMSPRQSFQLFFWHTCYLPTATMNRRAASTSTSSIISKWHTVTCRKLKSVVAREQCAVGGDEAGLLFYCIWQLDRCQDSMVSWCVSKLQLDCDILRRR